MADVNLDATELNITVRRGDGWTFKVEMLDAEGLHVTDLPSGWSGQVRKSKSSDEVIGSIDIDESLLIGGVVCLTFPELDCGSYAYDVEYPSGDQHRTPFGGRITVVQDVTR